MKLNLCKTKPTPSKNIFNTFHIPKQPVVDKNLERKHTKLLSNFILLSIPKHRIFTNKSTTLSRNTHRKPSSFLSTTTNLPFNASVTSNSKQILQYTSIPKQNLPHSKSDSKLKLKPLKQHKHKYFSRNDSVALEKAKMFMREIEKREKMITPHTVIIPKRKLIKKLRQKEGGFKFVRNLNNSDIIKPKMKKMYLQGVSDSTNYHHQYKAMTSRNDKHNIKINNDNVKVIQRNGLNFKEMVKNDMIQEKKIKAKDDWFYGYKEKEFRDKVKNFKQLRNDCNHKKLHKSNFMNRMIKFDSYNKTMRILGKVHMDVAFSQRKFITSKVGFRWNDPFCSKTKPDDDEKNIWN